MDEGGDDEPAERDDLEGHEPHLDLLGGFDPAVGDPRGDRGEGDGDRDVDPQHPREVGDGGVGEDLAEQDEEEVDADGGEVGQDEDGRGDQPQPPIQPSQGPKARVAHVKVVPESGIAELSSR